MYRFPIARPLTFVILLLGATGLPFSPGSAADPLGPSSRRTSWVVSEILYHPAPRTDDRDVRFVEIYNAGLIAEDLAGHRFAGDFDFTFPPNTVVAAGGFLVVAANPAQFTAAFNVPGVVGGYAFPLSDGGHLQLRNPAGAVILETRWSDEPPWPAAAGGAGCSLVLSKPSYGEADPRAWTASLAVGGSPGAPEPGFAPALPGVRFNEVLAHTDDPVLDFVELHNASNSAADLGGCRLTDDPARPGFVIPAGTSLPAGGTLAFDQSRLGFALSAAGETILLYSADGTQVIDALEFGPQANGVSWGRWPDGAPDFRELRQPTPGSANARPLDRPVVINEIMYHPISGDDDDEFVELYNRGTEAVDLAGWRFVSGIDFEFPVGVRLPAGGYLAVARNLLRLQTNHPGLASAQAVGNFRGSLANGGERLALAMPEDLVSTNATDTLSTNRVYVTVAEVTYRDGGAWGEWADGGGSSLELVDAHADPRLASNWADSNETAKAPWTTIESTGILDLGSGSINQLQIVPLGAGACLVDDVQAIGNGVNRVANGTFATDSGGWSLLGTLGTSRWEASEGAAGRGCLRVEAVARGDTGANSIRTPLTATLNPGTTATLRAQARWLRGDPGLLLRFRGNYLEAAARLVVPGNLGTPGARNSRALANAGPALADLSQSPALPTPNQDVTVTVRVDDPDGIASVGLRYRVDPASSTTTVAMRDDGVAPDARAGDGLYSGLIPRRASGQIVAYQIVARDAAPSPATTELPPYEALVRWGEAKPTGNLGTYRFWITQATFNQWSSRPKLDNAPLPITFVYNDERVVHGVRALFAGSPHISPGYSTPSGNLCGYTVIFPADDAFLGATDVVLDWPGRDATAQQEPTAYWIARELGIPFNHRRFVRLHVNGVTETARGSVYEDSQQVNSDLVRSWNPDADGGDLYKIEQWFEFSDSLGTSLVQPPRLENYTTTGGVKKTARYRWNWLPRAVADTGADFRNLFDLVDAANATSTSVYPRQLSQDADLEEWMRIFATEHIVVNLDSWGYDIGKNMYAFRPKGGRWQLHMWDIDWVMLPSAQHGYSPTSPLMYRGGSPFGDGNRDPVVGRMYANPEIQRAYWRAIEDAIHGPLVPGRVKARLDATYAALVAQGVTRSSGSALTNPNQVTSWLAQRRDFLVTQLAEVQAPFRLNPPPTAQSTNLLILSGTAPTAVASLRVNDHENLVSWSSISNWTTTTLLQPGLNTLVLQGYDRLGQPLPTATATASVRLTGTLDAAPDSIVINEIQFHPAVSGAGFVELFNRSATTAFDLSGWRLDGVGLEFPAGSWIAPEAYTVVAADRRTMIRTYANSPWIVAEFPGQLLNSGETLSLVAPSVPPAADQLVDRVTYDDQPPWPTGADGTGSSLQLIDPALDNFRPASWAVATSNPPPVLSRTLIPMDAVWRFDQSGADLGTAWRDPAYNDGTWPSGGALLYNESADLPGPKVTPLTLGPITFYFRTTFRFEGSTANMRLKLNTIIDDAAVLYLNGQEFYRLGFPAGATIGASTLSTRNVSDGALEGPFLLPTDLLKQGDNSLAVEVHQVAVTSTDITFGLSLETAPDTSPVRNSTPGLVNSVRGELPVLPNLWLNELQVINQSGPRDSGGDRDPWTELFNAGTNTVDLAGAFLSDSPTNLTRWAFPAGTRLAPGQHLVVWLDGEIAENSDAELHASFRTDPTAGHLTLTWVADGQSFVLDTLSYANLAPDQTIALVPDGQAHQRVLLPSGTPGTANTASPNPIVVSINEWLAGNTGVLADPADGDFDDWFELFNAGNDTADLTGCSLTDDSATPRKFLLPAGTRIPAKGFLLVWADEEGSQATNGAIHANFKLSLGGEYLALHAADGRLIDSVSFGPQSPNLTGGRWPDGGPVATNTLGRPSPAQPNAAPTGQSSPITITGIALAPPAQVTVGWLSEIGAVYRLESTSDLLAGPWEPRGTEFLATTTASSLSDTQAVADQRFYRVVRIR